MFLHAYFRFDTALLSLSRFANGRSTALVIDSGATHTTVAPVHEGYVLQNAVVRTPLGGDYVTARCRYMYKCHINNQIVYIMYACPPSPPPPPPPPESVQRLVMDNLWSIHLLILHVLFCRSFLQELDVEVVPPYMIASKEPIKEKMKPIWTKKPNLPTVTNSYHTYMCNVSTYTCTCMCIPNEFLFIYFSL